MALYTMVSSSHLVALLALACGAQAAPAWVLPFWNPFAMQAKSYSFSVSAPLPPTRDALHSKG